MAEGRFVPGVDGYPYTAICYVVATFPDGQSFRGTGVMVGPNDVLTAGQMLWDKEHGGAASSVTVTPGYNNGVAPFGTYQGALLSYYPVDQDGNGIVNRDEVQFDVGIIGLSKNIEGQTGSFGIKTHPLTGPGSEPEGLMFTGYPVSLDGAHGPRIMDDYIGAFLNDALMTFDFSRDTVDVRPGDLGAPIWIYSGGLPYVIGVDSTFSQAADVTKTFDQIEAWISGNDYLWLPALNYPPLMH